MSHVLSCRFDFNGVLLYICETVSLGSFPVLLTLDNGAACGDLTPMKRYDASSVTPLKVSFDKL